jgi:hypothetical protein
LAATALAAVLGSVLLWLLPLGSDAAAHVYQRELLIEHGFTLWNNFWYAGRYSFVTYSLAYYPLAALLGIRLLALASVTVASYAFARVAGQEWGRAARWAALAFAVAWATNVLSGAFPFLAASAAALGALLLLQQQRRVWAAAAILATLALSPLAFALLAVVLAAQALAHRPARRSLVVPATTVAVGALLELLLWRLFPGAGRYPFPLGNLLAACVFCLLGLVFTRRVEQARPLYWFFAVYLAACVAAYCIPSAVGENVARLRYLAVPIALLVLGLRHWRPLPISLLAVVLAGTWNLTPLAYSFAAGADDPAASRGYWQPAITFLQHRLSASYRVEAVSTADHWEATFLPTAGIPLARGWYRQDDFPENAVLYGRLDRAGYLRWLHRLAVAYVVLSDAPPDYSAEGEARLLRGGHSGLRPVFHAPHLTVFAVPAPTRLVRPANHARVLELTPAGLLLRVTRPGSYLLAIRYSAYWRAHGSCVLPTPDGMTKLVVRRPGILDLDFAVTAGAALDTLAGTRPSCPPSSRHQRP